MNMNMNILSAKLTTRTSGTAVFMHGQNRVVVAFRKRKTAVFADTAIISGKDVTDAISSVTFRCIERSIAQNLQQQAATAIDRTEVQYSRLDQFLQRPAVLGMVMCCVLVVGGLFGGVA